MSDKQEELDGLLSFLLPFAEQMLDREGAFHPFGALLTDRGIEPIRDVPDDDHPDPNALLDHLDPDLDASTAFRFHFGEVALSAGFRVVQVTVIGLSTWIYLVYELVFQVNTVFHHSNVKLPIKLERKLPANRPRRPLAGFVRSFRSTLPLTPERKLLANRPRRRAGELPRAVDRVRVGLEGLDQRPVVEGVDLGVDRVADAVQQLNVRPAAVQLREIGVGPRIDRDGGIVPAQTLSRQPHPAFGGRLLI
jgi:hypothetical protein